MKKAALASAFILMAVGGAFAGPNDADRQPITPEQFPTTTSQSVHYMDAQAYSQYRHNGIVKLVGPVAGGDQQLAGDNR